MADIVIRDIDESIVLNLNRLAKKNSMSREAYLRNILSVISVSDYLEENQGRYEALVKQIVGFMRMQGEVIEKNNMLLETLINEKWNEFIENNQEA